MATLEGEYHGIVTSSDGGFETSDRYTRPVGRAETWAQAAALLDGTHHRPRRRRPARASRQS
ncbi:hypothetical protein DNL40_09745 [Xylanimonas oleitrophica]|uniref:Uncharacterized protein n=1 Tax=Xylanimonas oleitrophica TaxID=2607479 RepID=A0A2W5WNJ9_9MICO|nr:hypothetical protein DNL40_09745 [Xylanimonas oleitrophica]